MTKLTVISFLAVVFVLASLSIGFGKDKTVRIRGDEKVAINSVLLSTLRFSPGPVTIKSGDTVTWVDADAVDGAPHTITIANAEDLPQTFFDIIFACVPCGPALAGHFPGGPPVLVLGDGELSTPGESLLFFEGGSVSSVINASPGTTLYYLCVIHPWMQGTINVK